MPSVGGSTYEFVARDMRDAEQRWVALDILEDNDGRTHDYFRKVSGKMLQAVKGFHDLVNDGNCPVWATWNIVEWSQKPVAGRMRYSAWVGPLLAGYLWIWNDFPSAEDGGPIMYVEILGNTPTNLQPHIWSRCLKGVGTSLLAFTVFYALNNGRDGRFALHAADDDAARFYRNLSERRNEPLFHPDRKDVAGCGPFSDEHPSLHYFETTASGAISLLEDYRRE